MFSSLTKKGKKKKRPPRCTWVAVQVVAVGVVCIGGVVRDQNEGFVAGFAKQVCYINSAYHVELLGIKEALLLPSLPRQQVHVVSDCLMTVQAI